MPGSGHACRRGGHHCDSYQQQGDRDDGKDGPGAGGQTPTQISLADGERRGRFWTGDLLLPVERCATSWAHLTLRRYVATKAVTGLGHRWPPVAHCPGERTPNRHVRTAMLPSYRSASSMTSHGRGHTPAGETRETTLRVASPARKLRTSAFEPSPTCLQSPALKPALTTPGCSEFSRPGEACGGFGVYAPETDAAHLVSYGLFALQHRGQESAGIAVSDGETVTVSKDMGLVSQVFDESRLAPLDGHLAIGHVRYSTTGSSSWRNAQPVYRSVADVGFALGHNGNLVNTLDLAGELGMLPGVLTSASELVG